MAFSRHNKTRVAQIAFAVAALAALAWGFQALIFSHAPSVFNDPKEDMSFAWFVPLFSLYVLWTERRHLVSSIGAPSWAGFAAMLPCLAIGFLGVRGIQVRLEVVAFAGLAVTIPWALFGRETAKRFVFPAAFLLFCIPLASFLDIITVHLRLLATSTAYGVLKGFGMEVIRQGTMVGAADGSFAIDVAEPCSGLRSIFALMALTAGYAYCTQPTWFRRAILFATSVPLAVLGNVARILSICIVASCASADFATGFYHDYSGYVVFAVAISLMIACSELINRIFARFGNSEKATNGDKEALGQPGSIATAIITLVVLIGAMIYQASTPKPLVTRAPDVHLPEISGFEATPLEASEAELTILPSDTQIEKKLYSARDGEWYHVTLVIGGTSKSSIHRPELCLPAQGCLMADPRTVEVDGRDWRFITLQAPRGGATGFAYTFFNQNGFSTASHTSRIFKDVVDRSILNRIDRWVMITINSSRADDASLSLFARQLEKGATIK